MTNARREMIQTFWDFAILVPFLPVVPLAFLIVGAWIAGDYVLGSMFRAIGF